MLLHSPSDLKKPGSEYLENWLLSLRDRQLVRQIGVSIYCSEDLEGVNPELLDVVQLPLSLYDQRLIQNSTISRLHRAGVSLHVRSIYLQGLLLAPEESWPNWVSPKVRQHHRRLIDLCRTKDCRLIDLALGFLKAQSDIDAVVVGISSLADLKGQFIVAKNISMVKL